MMVMMHRLIHGDINTPLESEEQAAFDVDEIMIQCISNNKTNRLRCLELLADVFQLAP